MTDQETAPENENQADGAPRRPGLNHFLWIGPLVTLAGMISYFLFFVRFPDLRDFPWVNLPLVALGVFLSGVGLWRAFSSAGSKVLSKALASVALLFSLGVAALFSAYLFSYSYQIPDAEGASQVAETAPDFSLPDENNETVQLADFQGSKLVITFYRGYW